MTTMKSLPFVLVCQAMLVASVVGEDGLPDPYKIFAEEQPKNYRITSAHTSLVQGDKIPDLSQRPRALRPGAIPARVRYAFTADSSVVAAAALVTQHFCVPAAKETTPLGRTLVVHPGAWAHLKQTDSLGRKSATAWGFLVGDGKVTRKFSGIVLRDDDELRQVETLIRLDVQKAGGATVRALTTEEMADWWAFIGFDIQEPTLVLETNDKKKRFILGFVDRQLVIVDELNHLIEIRNTQSREVRP